MREAVDTAVDVGDVPDRLAECDQWVCWREEERDGKQTKVPIRPGDGTFASTTDPDTWAGFEGAVEFAQEDDVSGIGFVFSDDDPIVGVDLDDCRDPETGDLGGTTRDIVERLDSYTEVSPSGTGLHVIVEGDLPNGRNRRGSIELYDSARFFTVSGDHVEGTPIRIASRKDAIEGVQRDYVQRMNQRTAAVTTDLARQAGRPRKLWTSTSRTSRLSGSQRKRRTVRSSNSCGTATRAGTTAIPRPTWLCAVRWRFGRAATGRRWIDSFASLA